MTRPTLSHRQAGFSLLELIVVLAVVGLAAAIGTSMWSGMQPRMKLQTTATCFSNLVVQARLFAIQKGADLGVDILVRIEEPLPGETFRPALVATTLPERRCELPPGVDFGGPAGGAAVSGFATPPDELAFDMKGSAADTGSFFIRDANDRNHFEIAVATLAGKTEIRKFLDIPESPTGVAGFFEQASVMDGQKVKRGVWRWY